MGEEAEKVLSQGALNTTLRWSSDCFLCKRGFQRLVARKFNDRGQAAMCRGKTQEAVRLDWRLRLSPR